MIPELVPTTPIGHLVWLLEECAEVQKTITKILRFGTRSSGYDNIGDLLEELDDLHRAASLVREDICHSTPAARDILYAPIAVPKGKL